MRRWALLALSGPLVTACGSVGPENPRLAEVIMHEARWDSVGPGSYVYTVERLCFCPEEYRGPVRVTVEDGVAVDRTYSTTGLPVPSDLAPAFPTVDGLFEIIKAAIDADAFEVRVTYDPTLGVPIDLWIDYNEMTADEELGMQVTEAVTPAP